MSVVIIAHDVEDLRLYFGDVLWDMWHGYFGDFFICRWDVM